MDIRIRPKRRLKKTKVVGEPHDSYSFYLPVEVMEGFRKAAEDARQSYSEAMTEAVYLYLAAKVSIQHMHKENSHAND
ncbi:MAG: hypothetical protein H0U59_06115 [Gemmatimonadaceae bacterium]|nr:hypothetical protein [Gemmatimonadaceae bacterium]